MKFCSTCGKELSEDSNFCIGCGTACNANAAPGATPTAPTAPSATSVAATAAIGFIKQFIKNPATAIKESKINQPEAIIYIAALPVSMLLFLFAFIWRSFTDSAKMARELQQGWGRGDVPSVHSLRSEAFERLTDDISVPMTILESIIHVAVWFAILVLVPFLLTKFVRNSEINITKSEVSNTFPVFAAVTIPQTIAFLASAVVTFVHLSAGMSLFITASVALSFVAFWILYTIAVKRIFNTSTEHSVLCTIVAYIPSSIYALFGMSRVAGMFFEQLINQMLGSLL